MMAGMANLNGRGGRVVLVEFTIVGDGLVVFGVRADWPHPEVAIVALERDDLTLVLQ
jgi:hypothetical protein